jgi:phosphatidylserine/phosphatidylglycerophosphate/cardiolipin synthase-like enzyme/uncharacterized membrane protein YdjX (TVP38/TMEM64 family)
MDLRPGPQLWRIETASRASVLIDAADYFGALRSALLKARRRVFIIGWDIHSRTPLVGATGRADDGYPEMLGEFLSALVRDRPQLNVHVLLWDFAVLYAGERELWPTYALRWTTPRRVRFCLDDAVPVGSSQHQKIVVIDDSLAFSGGLDLTVRRWDTGEHRLRHPLRRDLAGAPYRPFHDVQVMVEGEAARALAVLARSRWKCASGEVIRMLRTGSDVWPGGVAPDFADLPVGIARTQPEYDGQREVREVERLFVAMIGEAERAIYIENQFLSALPIAQALARRLRERPALELLLVAPARHDSWIEARSMRNGRIRFMKALDADDIKNRVRLMYPVVEQGGERTDTMVHAKVMIVDDRLLRVGSANLNNRSMGTDTECDVAFQARNAPERDAIAGIRHRLIGDHCGVRATAAAAALSGGQSLCTVADTLGGNGHRLVPIDDGELIDGDLASYIESMADPEQPIGAEDFVSSMLGGVVPRRYVPTTVKVAAAGVGIFLIALAWRYSPLSDLVDPKTIAATLQEFARGPWAPVIVMMVFVGGGLVMFPVTVLIAATAATFGPWLGFLYAAAGALMSALVGFWLGAQLGKNALRDTLGPKLNRIRRKIMRRGVLAVAAIRLVAVAPFTVVKMVAGAREV